MTTIGTLFAGGASGVKVWLTPRESARDVQEAGGTELRQIFGVRAYCLSYAPALGRIGE